MNDRIPDGPAEYDPEDTHDYAPPPFDLGPADPIDEWSDDDSWPIGDEPEIDGVSYAVGPEIGPDQLAGRTGGFAWPYPPYSEN